MNDAALLALWEQAQPRGPAARTVLLLGVALPALDEAARAALSIAAADRALLGLRRSLFGARMPAELACPHCAERLEFTLDADALLAAASEPDPASGRFRLPSIGDLATIAATRHVGAAIRQLADLCCVDDDPAAARTDADLAELDAMQSQAAIQLRLDCAACGHEWREDLDIAFYLWDEIGQCARGLLDTVHVLARCYGWSESEILALSDARRAAYLQRCDG